MKCKVFTGRHWDTVEKQAYSWLATQAPQLQLHHSETLRHVPAIVKVWYELDRGRPVPAARPAATRPVRH